MLNNIFVIYLISHFISCCFIRIDGLFTEDSINDYIDGFYLMFATAASIGYGDITLQHKKEEAVFGRYAFACLLIYLSIVFFVHIQLFLSNLVKEWNQAKIMYREASNSIDDWFAAINLTPGVCISGKYERMVKDYFLDLAPNNFKTVVEESEFFSKLEYRDQRSLLKSITREVRHTFKDFFCDFDEQTAVDICSESTLVNFEVGDIVVKSREMTKGIYFILYGSAKIVYKGKLIGAYIEKQYCGDCSLVDRISGHSVICHENLLCLFIPKTTIYNHLGKGGEFSLQRCRQRAERRTKELINQRKLINHSSMERLLADVPIRKKSSYHIKTKIHEEDNIMLNKRSSSIKKSKILLHKRHSSQKSDCNVDDDSLPTLSQKVASLFHELRPPWEKNLRVLKNDKPINKSSIHKQSASSISSGKDKGVYLLVEPKEKLPKPVDDDVLLTLPNDVPETPDNPVDKIEMPSPDPFFAELPESQCPKRHLLETEKSMSQDKNSEAVSKVNNLAMQSENIDYDNIEGDDSASTISNEEVHEKASLCGDSVDDSDDMEDIRASLDTKDWPHSLSSMLEIIEAKLGYVRIKYSNFLDRLEKEHAFVATDVLHTINRIKTAPLLVAVNTLVHQHPRPNL